MAKRKQLAAGMRQDADHLANPANPVPQLLRLLESLAYEKDDATVQKGRTDGRRLHTDRETIAR